jgi:hypothetical protein
MVEARGNGSASKEANLMSKAEEFRISAAERDNLANQAKDPEAKRMLHETAERWPIKRSDTVGRSPTQRPRVGFFTSRQMG